MDGPMVIAAIVISTGLVKLADFLAASIFVFRRREGTVSVDGETTRVDFDWTPIFAWSARRRERWRTEGLAGSARDRLLSVIVDLLFRAPALAALQAILLLLSVGSVEGSPARGGMLCAFASIVQPTSAWMTVVAGAICVSVAAIGIFSLLELMLLAPSGNLEVNVGQYLSRSRPSGRSARPFGPILVAPAVTGALFLGFAALYLALFAADHSAFKTPNCHIDAIGMIYFSTSVGATVGFGDIVPASDAARLIVSIEIFFFVTLLALFLQTLRYSRRA